MVPDPGTMRIPSAPPRILGGSVIHIAAKPSNSLGGLCREADCIPANYSTDPEKGNLTPEESISILRFYVGTALRRVRPAIMEAANLV